MVETLETQQLALFGSPLENSLSPAIHHAFARQFGISINYHKIEAGPHTFARKLQTFVDSGGRGCNITVPLKTEAWELASRTSRRAQQAQAVNTLCINSAADWYGDNTDGQGLLADLETYAGYSAKNQHILLLGAGGAAAGVLAPLLQQQAVVTIANRTPQRAADLAERLQHLGAVSACALTELPRLGAFDLIINSTALGHRGLAPDFTPNLIKAKTLCYDLNYGAAAQPLRHRCQQLSVRFRDGLGMLVAQAACAFELWFGTRPDTAPVLTGLIRGLADSKSRQK